MLLKFDFKYIPRKSIKRRVVSLVDLLTKDYKEEKFRFPYEEVLQPKKYIWMIYFDGFSNQKGFGVDILLVFPEGAHNPISVKLDFKVTGTW